MVLGAVLLLGAIAVAVRQPDWSALREASPAWAALLGGIVLVNLLTLGLLNWIVTRSFDANPPVGLTRMAALIAASALLNYLPLRPGLLGRAAYLKLHHALPLRQSFLILLIITGAGALTSAVMIGLLLLRPEDWPLPGLLLLAIGSCFAPPLARWALHRPIVDAWSWLALRTAIVLLAGTRLWIAFTLIGHPVSFDRALLAAAAGMLATLAGVTPNGLGLREWIIAAASPVGAAGLAAALIDRAVEVVIIIPTGLIALRSLKRA